MRKLNVLFLILALFPLFLRAQISEKDKFSIHIVKVKRTGSGCTAQVESDKVRYELTSDVSAACGMLNAGADYKAYRESAANDSKDESKDKAVLIVFNNGENKRRPNSVFDISSEEVLSLKPCPKDDPLGLYVTHACQPLPPKEK